MIDIEKHMTIETLDDADTTGVVDRKPSKKKTKLKPPRDYKVILHNDDFTPMEFVVFILETIFHKPTPEAERIMKEVHEQGKGIAGVYTHEIAEQKVYDTVETARDNQYPLQVTAEVV